MRGKEVISIVVLGAALSLACDIVLLTPAPTPTPSVTPTDTATPTVTSSPTESPYPTPTASPTPVPGIEEPVPVGDAKLLITKALRREEYRCGDNRLRAEDPAEKEFLIILWKVVGGPQLSASEVENWVQNNEIDRIQLDVRNDAGRGNKEEIQHLCYIRNRTTYALTEIHMAFLIEIRADTFSLIMPDGVEIPLESLLPS